MKKLVSLLTILLVGSFLCFTHPNHSSILDWSLFLVAFLVTILGVQFFMRSLGRPKSVKKRREREGIYEALPHGIVLFSSKGRVHYINHNAEKLLGVARSKILGQQFLEFTKEEASLIEKSKHLLKRCQESGFQQNLSFCLETSGQKSCDLTVKPIPGTGRYLLLIEDSSSQYQMHQLGKDFVANASHELRTPITIIKGFAETLSELPEVSEAMFHDFTEKIIRNCGRMDALVKNLLTLTDLDYLPQARLQECDLVALVDSCIHTLLAVHQDAHIEALQNKEIITISADPDLLELALMNLLENSVKYSSGPANLTITVEDCSEEVRLSIADKGLGIPKSDLEHIFKRFYTVNKSHSRSLGGAGLGLSIVKTIIKKHEGTIEVSSQIGKGTEFSLTFRRAPQPSLI